MVVFDLDDTLIAERDYQLSGIRAVDKHLSKLYLHHLPGSLLAAHRSGVTDLWGHACDVLELSPCVAKSLLWVYRLHFPEICLLPGIPNLLSSLEQMEVPVVVLSDGRSSSQRLKLRSVGLQDLPCYLSEEWESNKPELLRFHAIAERWPHKRYVYIGDNPVKDFEAPLQLGWLTLGAAWTPNPVHIQCMDPGVSGPQPHAWLKSPHELLAWLR